MAPTNTLLLGLHDAAETLGLGRSKLYELLQNGELRSVKIGKRRLVVRESLDEYVHRLEAQSNAK